MDFRSPEPVARALREYVDGGVFGYPRGLHSTDRARLGELTAVVVDRMRDRYGWTIEPDFVVPVPGAVAALNIACRSFAASDDAAARRTVLVNTPVYPQILNAPLKAGLAREESALRLDAPGRHTIDWNGFDAAVRRAGMFILCNPHNPVGRVFSRQELERMAEICLSAGTIICSDEIHSDLVYDGHQHLPIAALDPSIAGRTITIMGPSKTFNLAGLQCAFAIVPDPVLRRRYERVRNSVVAWVNAPGLIGAESAYRHGEPWLRELVAYLQANRDFVCDFVERELPGLRVTAPEGTYLAWIDCRGLGVENPYEFFLQKARVALSNGQDFGTGGAGFARLNFACPRAVLEDALGRMRAAL